MSDRKYPSLARSLSEIPRRKSILKKCARSCCATYKTLLGVPAVRLTRTRRLRAPLHRFQHVTLFRNRNHGAAIRQVQRRTTELWPTSRITTLPTVGVLQAPQAQLRNRTTDVSRVHSHAHAAGEHTPWVPASPDVQVFHTPLRVGSFS